MHLTQPEELQVVEREAEAARRYSHHPATRYEPDHFEPRHYQRDPWQQHHEVEGLPVHDRYGDRVLEHDPYHQEYVHGTNYELTPRHGEPVIEHNPHAFPSTGQQPKGHLSDPKPKPTPTAVPAKKDAPKAAAPAKKED